MGNLASNLPRLLRQGITVPSCCLLHACHWENVSQPLKSLGTDANLGKAFKPNCCSCLFQQFLCTPVIWRVYILLMLLVTFCVSFFTEVSAFVYHLFPGVNRSSIWSGLPTPICINVLLLQKHKSSGFFFFFFPCKTQSASIKSILYSTRDYLDHIS